MILGQHGRAAAALITLWIGCSLAYASDSTLNFRASGTEFEVSKDGQLAVSDRDLKTYVEHGATAVAAYFGHFPLKRVNIHIRVVGGNRVRFGRSTPVGGGTIMLMIGSDTSAETLLRDWTLTHEMTHLAFPATKEDDRDWLAEGMATYIEPIARAQCGYLTDAYVWNQFADNMPKGEPAPGDQGLNNTRTWGRTYWGGALFWLVADVEIRKQTHNQKGAEDAFRGIMRQDGTMEYEWPMKMIFETGDKATGTHVLEDLYTAWKDKPVEVDLPKLWRELGIEKKGDAVVFHDDAPLTAIRKAMTRAK